MLNLRAWAKQPQFSVGVDWSNPLTRGLIALHSGATGLWDATGNGRALTKVSVPTIVPGPNGLGFKSATSSYFKTASLTGPVSATNEITVLMMMVGGTTSDQGLGVLSSDATNMEHYPYGGAIYSSIFYTTRWISGTASKVALNSPHVLTVRGKPNYRIMCQNGLTVNLSAASGNPTLPSGGTLWIGSSLTTGSTWFYSGHMPVIAIWNRYLSDMEESMLSRSLTAPWQLFAPLSRQIWVPSAAAGASIYTISSATYAPGSITATGVTPRVSVAVI